MALRMAAMMPFRLQLRALALQDVAPGWQLLSQSCDGLPEAPVDMACDDVFVASMSLCTPDCPGTSALGKLQLAFQRLEAGEGGEDVPPGLPATARAAMHEERTVMHALPRVAVCPRVLEAWFEAPAAAPKGGRAAIKMKLSNCSDAALNLRVYLGTGAPGTVVGEPFQDVWLAAQEAGEALWEISTHSAGLLSCLGTVQVSGGDGRMTTGGDTHTSTAGAHLQLEFSIVASMYVM
jgi:hypothetical protein